MTIRLVFACYSISSSGVSFARQGRISPGAGVWLADLAFLAGGVFLLWQSERRPMELLALRSWLKASKCQVSRLRACLFPSSMPRPQEVVPNGEFARPAFRESIPPSL